MARSNFRAVTELSEDGWVCERVPAKHANLAGRGSQLTREQFDERGLSCAVLTEERRDAGPDFTGDVVDADNLSVPSARVDDGDHP